MWSCSDRGGATLRFSGKGLVTTRRSRAIGHGVGHGGRGLSAPKAATAAPSAPGSR